LGLTPTQFSSFDLGLFLFFVPLAFSEGCHQKVGSRLRRGRDDAFAHIVVALSQRSLLLLNGAVAGVICASTSAAVLAGETDNDQKTEGDEEGEKCAEAGPPARILETIVLKNLIGYLGRFSVFRDGELSNHHGGEAVPDR